MAERRLWQADGTVGWVAKDEKKGEERTGRNRDSRVFSAQKLTHTLSRSEIYELEIRDETTSRLLVSYVLHKIHEMCRRCWNIVLLLSGLYVDFSSFQFFTIHWSKLRRIGTTRTAIQIVKFTLLDCTYIFFYSFRSPGIDRRERPFIIVSSICRWKWRIYFSIFLHVNWVARFIPIREIPGWWESTGQGKGHRVHRSLSFLSLFLSLYSFSFTERVR